MMRRNQRAGKLSLVGNRSEMQHGNVQTKRVKSIQFCILSPEDMAAISVVLVDSAEAFESGVVKEGGLFDLKMGPLDNKEKCHTCARGVKDCPGHFGHIELEYPCINPGQIDCAIQIAKCVCFHCSRLLLDKKNPKYKHLMAIPNPKTRMDQLLKLVKNKSECDFPYKDPVTKQIKNGGCRKRIPIIKHIDTITLATHYGEDTKKEPLSSEQLYNILRRIDPEDYEILGCDQKFIKPHWMILQHLLVPPVCLRPSNTSNVAARGEDDLTYKLSEILKFNTSIKKLRANGDPKNELPACIQLLQHHVATYIDNSIGQQTANQRGGRPIKGLAQRLEKKEGRVRGNLMGKRTDFAARTVITPDPDLELDQIGIPYCIAANLTFPEPVNRFNYERLSKSVKIGPWDLGGANWITTTDGKS